MRAAHYSAIAIGLLLFNGGCRPGDQSADIDTSKPSDFGFQLTNQEALVKEGRSAYALYCAGCHGEQGNGWGPSARFYHPRPRNFQLANFKFSSTRSGQMPTDADLRRTITKGLKGSAMPPFELLPARTVDALISYIKTFSPKWADRGTVSPILIVEDPYRAVTDKSAARARGEAVYHGFATCWTCHPAYVPESRINDHLATFGNMRRETFRPLLSQGVGKATSEGDFIYPPDFLRDFTRSGATLDDLYRVIGAGITGTAMPTWIDSIDLPGDGPDDPPLVQPSDIWAMAYYVEDLLARRPQKLQPGAYEIRDQPREIQPAGTPPPQPVSDDDGAEDEDFEFEEFEDEAETTGGDAK